MSNHGHSKRAAAENKAGDETAKGAEAPPHRQEVAEYLDKILPELAVLADRAGMDVTSHLIKIAHHEVREDTDA